ncbi:Stress response NST1-like protein [Quillaja saponaria]|uniref:Stress response NST1-like protein n=1 Tax=Quillaja saponaria TaxID=32244 RepID=A0AAD7M4M4_QUISA|nr:Stress response NST1-like protein [Quillaja saponaria]
MDSMASNKGQPVRKPKKKQVKDELDRLKQAEKKKRRLEKALATSAAIISELEKKKQKKKEEQQRLDEEGAAIAEAVALHVLLGEDSDDQCNVVVNEGSCNSWDCDDNVDLFMGERRACFPNLNGATCSVEGMGGWVSDAYGSGYKWGGLGSGEWSFSSQPMERDFHAPFYEEAGWQELSAGLVAAQAVASLQIEEDAHEDRIVFNRMLREQI